MKHTTKYGYALIGFLSATLFLALTARAVEPPDELTSRPAPRIGDGLLFYVQRSHNNNTVIYLLNLAPNGRLNSKEPLHPLWLRYEEGGVRKELTFIQNRVYGLIAKKLDEDRYLLLFRAYKKREIYLVRSANGNGYRTFIKIKGKMAVLTSLFIQSSNNSLGIPSIVNYIDINGLDPITAEPVHERIIP